jgi:hypothetical protein
MYQGQQPTFNYNTYSSPGGPPFTPGGTAWKPSPGPSDDDRYGKKNNKDPVLSVVRYAMGWLIKLVFKHLLSATRLSCRWIKARSQKEKMYLGIGASVLVSPQTHL